VGAYSDRVIADGATHYWRLGEPSGTTAADSIAGGANAPGTISAGVTLNQTGPLADGSTAMAFNGNTSTPKITTVATVTLPAIASVEAWIRSTSAAGSDYSICSTAAVPPACALYQANTGQFGTSDHTANGVNGTTVIANGPWRHVVATWDGTTVRIYVDGVSEGSAGWARAAITTAFYIGTYLDTQQGWLGSIAEVAIYPTALSAPTIAAHYALRTATGGGGRSPIPWGAFAQQGSPA